MAPTKSTKSKSKTQKKKAIGQSVPFVKSRICVEEDLLSLTNMSLTLLPMTCISMIETDGYEQVHGFELCVKATKNSKTYCNLLNPTRTQKDRYRILPNQDVRSYCEQNNIPCPKRDVDIFVNANEGC